MKIQTLFIAIVLMLGGCCSQNSCNNKPDSNESAISWQKQLDNHLPLLGHRNWILIVDKAFPLQSSSGMKYINTGAQLPQVVATVLSKLDSASHVKAIVYTDRELQYITEELVPGIDEFKKSLYDNLSKYNVQTLLHDEVFKKLDESALLFNVTVLKTEGLIPYSSVFIELDCGYWSAAKEESLRNAMK